MTSRPLSAAVPATPVAVIEIEGSMGAAVVRVNGDLVEHDGTRDPHHVAVHAVAERVAQVLDRPVRAIASDGTTRAALVVHPSGETSNIEILQRLDPAAVEGAAVTSGTAPAEADEASVSVVASEGPMDQLVMKPAEPEATGWWRRAGVLIAAASTALVVVLGATGVVLLARGASGTEAPKDARSSTSTDAPPSSSASPAPSSSTPPAPAESSSPSTAASVPGPTRLQVVSVGTKGGRTALRFKIAATVVPTPVVIRLTGPDGSRIARVVEELVSQLQTVRLSDVPAGTVHWTVRVPGAEQVDGVVEVAAAAGKEPTRSPGTSGGSAGSGSGGSSVGSSSSKPAPKPSSKSTKSTKPKPKPKGGGSGPKGVHDGRGPVGLQDPAG